MFVVVYWLFEIIIVVIVSGVFFLIFIVVIGVWFIVRSRFKKIFDRLDFIFINFDYERKILILVLLGFEIKIIN